MGLEYNNTCPDIDGEIDGFKEEIFSFMSDLANDICPLLTDEQKQNVIDDYKNPLYEVFESSFENVRQVNADMREEATSQIDSAEATSSELEGKLEEKDEQIEKLEKELERVNELYNETYSNLESENG